MQRNTAAGFVVGKWDFPKFIQNKCQWNPIKQNQQGTETHSITENDQRRAEYQTETRTVNQPVLMPFDAPNGHGLARRGHEKYFVVGFKVENDGNQNSAD